MKKFLSIVSIFSLTTTGATTLVACTKVGDSKDESNNSESNNDLAKIKIIEAPEEMTVMDPIAVTKAEIKIVLDPIILSAVQWINKTATTVDFTYDVFKDKDGSELETVNLQDSKVDVYVQIVAAQDSMVVIGNTGYIKVTLPQLTKIEKVDISSREGTIPYNSALEIKAANPNAGTINELKKINIEATLVAKVLKIVKDIVEAVTAEDYTITNNAQPGDYSKQQEVIILVKAKDTSKYISGKFAFKGYVKAIK